MGGKPFGSRDIKFIVVLVYKHNGTRVGTQKPARDVNNGAGKLFFAYYSGSRHSEFVKTDKHNQQIVKLHRIGAEFFFQFRDTFRVIFRFFFRFAAGSLRKYP